MNKPKIRKLNEVVNSPVPEGYNDGKWFLLEHQLYQFRLSIQQVHDLARQISACPENEEEGELAFTILDMISPVFLPSLSILASVKSLLAGTDVAERIARQENG